MTSLGHEAFVWLLSMPSMSNGVHRAGGCSTNKGDAEECHETSLNPETWGIIIPIINIEGQE